MNIKDFNTGIEAMTDVVPSDLYLSYLKGAEIIADSNPCSVCREANAKGIYSRMHFHGSDLGKCARRVLYNMRGTEPTPIDKPYFLNDGHIHEASMINTINAGTLEYHIVPAKNEQEINYSKQIKIEGKDVWFEIIGHYDGVLLNKDKQPVAIIECKSVKEYSWNKIKKEGEISKEYYGQVHFYMLATEIFMSYLLVKHRMTSEMMQPIRIPWNKEFVIERIKKLKEVLAAYMTGGDVEKEHKRSTDSECKFCPFKDRCWGGEQLNLAEVDLGD